MTRANFYITINKKKIYFVIDSSAYPKEIKNLFDKNIKTIDELKNSNLWDWANSETISFNKIKELRAYASYNYHFNFDKKTFKVGDCQTDDKTWKITTINKVDLFNK